MTDPLNPEVVIFNAAIELPPTERADYLAKACAGDAELLNRINALLNAYDASGKFLINAAPHTAFLQATRILGEETKNRFRPVEKLGDIIDHYKLLQQLGEGGCGVVYMAEQSEPVRRQVALKVIKLGMDTKSVIARFEAERQALAMMDHPNIAKVLDAGTTSAGRPYFVMELVRGIRITDFCDQNNLSTRDRLGLFIEVCQAIQHAHQKGIIHRDIKPSNILVTLNDGVPMPKVIDFGIAKATQQRLTDKTLFTAFEQFLGTPAYMSPEQAELSAQGVDTRSDIYSLGVLLYELLTGQTPFAQHDLMQAGVDEIRRVIREEEPMRPSTRLSTMVGGELKAIAGYRRVEPPKLLHTVRGELDWIAMKALEKSRIRRYETAADFARDVQRYLADEPVKACPPSKIYQFRKAIRRHKFAFALVASILVTLAIGLGISSYLFVKERQARRQAATAAERSHQTSQFLEDMLQGVGPSVALGRDTTLLREILDKTLLRVETELTNQPEAACELDNTISSVYLGLQDNAKAESVARKNLALAERNFGKESIEAADTLCILADALRREQEYAEAEKMIRESIATSRKLQGDENEFLPFRVDLLGDILRCEHKQDEAEPVLRQALALSKKFKDKSIENYALNDMALLLDQQKKFTESESLFREALSDAKGIFGPQSPAAANIMQNLANVMIEEKKLPEAEEVFRQALAITKTLFGHENAVVVANCQNGLLDVLEREGKFVEAKAMLDEILTPEMESRPEGVRYLHSRSTLYARRGLWREALPDMTKALNVEPGKYTYYIGVGTLLAAMGDTNGYAAFCNKYLTNFPSLADDPYWVARTCVVMPCPQIDMQAVNKLVDATLVHASNSTGRFLPGDHFLKSIVEYRLGNYASAVDYADLSLKGKELDASDYVRLVGASDLKAMSLFKLHQTNQAMMEFAKASRLAEAQVPRLESGDVGPFWRAWVLVDGLNREARKLIQPDAEAVSKK